ncbi:MAG: chromosome segregation protein SMC [Chloroflexota bacterium]|nr:chromosome segregation protein SMC [Chloroflexota bacterium]
MSRLKELRLHGFKSFADQTRFIFEPGVNAVIGPNGSGKSNMADAVRWVLGEQSNRSLRTRRADDVIFGGSERRKPQGMAEASLTLDNADGWLPIDFAEVAIGRRAYRSGESEYLINGARARLRDVVDLLGGGRLGANELVVVGQGTVDSALSLRPDERRQLFEEAAGVKALQVKRNEASGRLNRALANLTRMNDLIGELKPQVRRLAMQAEHQQQHDTLGARARAMVTTSHHRREQAARAELGEARRRAAAAESALAAYRDDQEAGRAEVATAEALYWTAEEASRAAGEARQRAREGLIRVEGRIEAVVARETELIAAIEREVSQMDLVAQALDRLVRGTRGKDIEPAIATAAAAEELWRATVAELAAADDALLAAEQAVSELRARHSDLIASRARVSEEAARQRTRLSHAIHERSAAETALGDLRETAAVAAEHQEASASVALAAMRAFEATEARREEAQEAADATRRTVIELTERLGATRAELEALVEPHDGARRLGRRLSAAGWPTLLDTVVAPEAAWPAIEATVGGDVEEALLWTDGDLMPEIGDARGAARLLAPQDAAIDGREVALAAVGGSRTVAEWIGMPDGPGVFARAALAADLPALLSGWRRLPVGWAAVTVEGDFADARGITLRGRGDPPGGAAARAHTRRLEVRGAVRELESRFRDAQEGAHAATEVLRAVRNEHLAAREVNDEADGAARNARETRAAADATVGREQERVERLIDDLAAMQSVRVSPEAAASEVGDDELSVRQAAADGARARRDAIAARRDVARDAWTADRHTAEEIETRTAGMRSERLTLEARLAQLEVSIPQRRIAIAGITEERAALTGPAEAARAEHAAADEVHQKADQERVGRREELVALEREQGGAGARLGELERVAQGAAIEASRRDEALSGLLRERQVALDGLPELETDVALPSEEVDALDDAQLEAELRRVRRTLSQIGSVNPFAVEEHRELASRLNEMATQDTDLRAAISSTEELIGTLDGEISAQFDTAFRAIGERFDEYCRLLFAGGSGSLQMGDEANGDAPGGIEIVVRPPGKRLQRLAMLSGGERALTGVALLFAMLTVNPIPFCILDEVDAALDEANIGRFAQALRKLSESIDFVVITHNRATIEVADTIYGVTMTDAAVSRVLSLRLADLPAQASA